jgi:hypothetical protein
MKTPYQAVCVFAPQSKLTRTKLRLVIIKKKTAGFFLPMVSKAAPEAKPTKMLKIDWIEL